MPSSHKTLALLSRIRATEIETADLPAALATPLGRVKDELSALDDAAFDAFLDDQAAKLGPTRPTERKRTVEEARAVGRDSAVVRQRRQVIAARKPAAKRFVPKPFSAAQQPAQLEGGR
ncbi:MAG: hypothetical protein JXL80_18210 [Planctomycetes bacterium]|nr:hypothetical protein [Planctomycetota bacterium]